MEMFLKRAIESIFSESPKRSASLRESCQKTLNLLNKSNYSITDKGEKSDAHKELDASLINTLKLACDSKYPRIMSIALDTLQKLMDYGYIHGESKDTTNSEKKLTDTVIEIISSCLKTPDDNVQLQIIKAFLTAVISPSCEIHETTLLNVIGICINIYLMPRNNTNQITAKATLTQMLNNVFQRTEIFKLKDEMVQHFIHSLILDVVAKAINTSSSLVINGEMNPLLRHDPDVVYLDCFLIFRALCNLSLKEVDGLSIGSIDMQTKVLSLELLLSLLEAYGPFLRENEKFVSAAIKKFLCTSIYLNSSSSAPRVFQLSLLLLHTLITHFFDHMKHEIGIFFKKIYLHVLETSTYSLHMKKMVVQVMYRLCSNPQTLVDLFVNYDCDISYADIFEDIVKNIAQISKGVNELDVTSQEPTMRLLSLETLVTIVKSLVSWSQREENDQTIHREESKDTLVKEVDVSANQTSTFVEQFQKRKHIKQKLEYGKHLFNQKPKQGIRYLFNEKLLEETADAVSKFLRTESLDKAKIGEYIGDPDPFHISVLFAFIDAMNFRNMDIDIALRHLIHQFRLPGEPERIDRIMEKFAERYFNDNPDSVFANADAVYVLSYAIIMLATDLHSPAIVRKITLPEWAKNLRGQNDSKDFPEKFLSDIYDRIEANELRMDESQTKSNRSGGKPRTIETKLLLKKSQELFKEKETRFFKSTDQEHVKSMFVLCWCPMLAAFGDIMENSEDEKTISWCLDGFQNAIKIAARFNLETQRDAFVSSLSQFTLLSNVREMKQKNIESIKTLIQLASSDGNYLCESWTQVLTCVSQLERLQLIGSGVKNVIESSPMNSREGKERQFRQFEGVNASAIAQQIDQGSIDRIFIDSHELNSDSIVYFVQCLCHVSFQEITSNPPRTFSLQKLVEIAYFNMNRIRLVWSRIWGVLAIHFTTVGCDHNQNIAMYAIDSLRQLAMKFLEKDELANYNFQKDFLKPFETIITNSRNTHIRELIIRCLSQMILARAQNIKSGWKSMFAIFNYIANDREEIIVSLSFEIVDKIVQLFFHFVSEQFFVECVNCLVSYACNTRYKDIALKGVKALGYCAAKLAQGQVCNLADSESPFTDSDSHLKLWFPIFTGLSRIISHPNIEVRTGALQTLFSVLKTHGRLFNKGFWELVFRGVLLPIFDSVRIGESSLSKENSSEMTTCLTGLNLLVDLFSYFFDRISFLSNEILSLFTSCILFDNEQMSKIGATCFLQLILTNKEKWTPENWESICVTIDHILYHNFPTKLRSQNRLITQTPKSPSNKKNLQKTSTQPSGSAEDADAPPEDSSARDLSSASLPTHPLNGGLEIPKPHKVSTPAMESMRFALRRALQQRSSLPFKTTANSTEGNSIKDADQHGSNLLARCNIHLLLLAAVNDISQGSYNLLNDDHLRLLLGSLRQTHRFSRNSNRLKAFSGGLSNNNARLLNQALLKLEESSSSGYLRLLFRMYSELNRSSYAEPRLIKWCKRIIEEFIELEAGPWPSDAVEESYQSSKVPVIHIILTSIFEFSDEQFRAHLPVFFPLFAELTLSDTKSIRSILRNIFLRIGSRVVSAPVL